MPEVSGFIDQIIGRLVLDAPADGFLQSKSGQAKWQALSKVLESLVMGSRTFRVFDVYAGSEVYTTTAVTGTGAISVNQWSRLEITTAATASSTARAATNASAGLSEGKDAEVINWSKIIVLAVRVMRLNSTAAGRFIFGLGRAGADSGQPDDKFIGFSCDNATLHGYAHNGVSLNDVNLVIALPTTVYTLIIVSDGLGNVYWYGDDGTLLGSSTSGPTGDSTNSHNTLHFYAENNADAAAQAGRIFRALVGVEQ